MPRKPTGNPRGRPKGTGRLGEQTRFTVRIPTELYARLEAFAEGRSFTRGTPQLAGCMRDALEHYLACPYKRQTGNTPVSGEYNNRQTISMPLNVQDNTPQTENGTAVQRAAMGETGDNTRQTIIVPAASTETAEAQRASISLPENEQGEPDENKRQPEKRPVPREQTARAAPSSPDVTPTDDLDDMPLEPENGSATLLRQPDKEPSGREAAPAQTADTPGADTPVARRRARVLAVVPWEADTPGGVSPAAIRSATGLRKIDVANDVDDLCKHGLVIKVSKGQYVRREAVPRNGQDNTRQTTIVPAASGKPAEVHSAHMSQPINEQMSSETLPGQTQGRAENITRQTAIPPYDTTRYILGKLCTHGHDYHGTGHSLRRLSDRECLECLKARRSAYRERQRQAQPA